MDKYNTFLFDTHNVGLRPVLHEGSIAGETQLLSALLKLDQENGAGDVQL